MLDLPQSFDPFRPIFPPSDFISSTDNASEAGEPHRASTDDSLLLTAETATSADLLAATLDMSELIASIPLIDSPPLSDIVSPSNRVVIAVTDATRPCPDDLLLRKLRRELAMAGVLPSNITILCATGLHRPMTRQEAEEKFGSDNLEDITFLNHSATERDQLVDFGSVNGIPVVVNRLIAEADCVIATGIVEPHQYAGFSGGSKTVVIGCGGEETIRETHGVRMLDREGTRLGKIEGNPFQEFVRAAGEKIGIDFVINLLLHPDGTIIAGAAGRPNNVHDYLARRARELFTFPVDQPVHAALLGVPESKGLNLYQASRAATYLALTDSTPLLKGGPIIIQAPIPEGAGKGKGEERFYQFLSEAQSPEELIQRMRRDGFPAGAQRAYIVARTLQHHPIIIVGAKHPDIARACHLQAVQTIEEGIERAASIVEEKFGLTSQSPSPPSLLILQNGLIQLPQLPNP